MEEKRQHRVRLWSVVSSFRSSALRNLSLYAEPSYNYDVKWNMMHRKDLSYQLAIHKNERWIPNMRLIHPPVRMPGYLKCVPVFLGKAQKAAWCPQQLALSSWQLLHLLLQREPILHHSLVFISKCSAEPATKNDTDVQGRDIQQRPWCEMQWKANVSFAFEVTAQSHVNNLWSVHWWIRWGYGGCPRSVHVSPCSASRAGGEVPQFVLSTCQQGWQGHSLLLFSPMSTGSISSLSNSVRWQPRDRGLLHQRHSPLQAILVDLGLQPAGHVLKCFCWNI